MFIVCFFLQPLVKLVELRSYNDEPIVSATISSDGTWLIYSTGADIRIFRVEIMDDDTAKLIRIKRNLPAEFTTCQKLFVSARNYLFQVKKSGKVDIFKLANEIDVEYRKTIDTGKCK